MEVSPSRAVAEDFFLHVLTAAENTVENVPQAEVESSDTAVRVAIGPNRVTLQKDDDRGRVEIAGRGYNIP